MNAKQKKQLMELRTGKALPECSGNYWPDDLVHALDQDFSIEQFGISELALKYKRTEVAIYQQLQKRGLLKEQCQANARSRSPRCSECLCRKCFIMDCPNRREEYADAGRI